MSEALLCGWHLHHTDLECDILFISHLRHRSSSGQRCITQTYLDLLRVMRFSTLKSVLFNRPHLGEALFLSSWQCLLCTGSVLLRFFLFAASHSPCKFHRFWWYDLSKQTESWCLGLRGEAGPGYQQLLHFCLWSAEWALKLQTLCPPCPNREEGKGRKGVTAQGGVLAGCLAQGEKGCTILQMETSS